MSKEAPILEPPAAPRCPQLSAAAAAIVTQAERSVPQCETAADCRAYSLSGLEICWSVCGDSNFGGPAQERALREARQSEELLNTCAEFRALGCTVQPPSCPLLPPPPDNLVGYECKSQRCEPVYR